MKLTHREKVDTGAKLEMKHQKHSPYHKLVHRRYKVHKTNKPKTATAQRTVPESGLHKAYTNRVDATIPKKKTPIPFNCIREEKTVVIIPAF